MKGNGRSHMKTAWLYAGQGAQRQGMGKDLYEAYPAFKKVIDEAAEYTDFDLKRMMFEESEEVLSKTCYTQPCLAAFAAGVTEVLKEAVPFPDITAGLSLGEYSALYCAGVFDLESLIKTTSFRGMKMQEASENIDTLMCAVMGLTSGEVEEICTKASEKGAVSISNYNSTGQYVISGEKEAVEFAKTIAKERGAKRCMDLKTSGPFHTKFMDSAAAELSEYFKGIRLSPMNIPVVFNCTGNTLEAYLKESGSGKDTDPENASSERCEGGIKDLLIAQMTSGVRMEQTIKLLESMGVERVIEIGPGRVLSGFIKRTAKGITASNIDTAADLEKLLGNI